MVIGGRRAVERVRGSPEQQGKKKAEQIGKQQFVNEMVDGIDRRDRSMHGLSTVQRRPPAKGDLGPPDPGESSTRPIEIQPGGLMAFGPFLRPKE